MFWRRVVVMVFVFGVGVFVAGCGSKASGRVDTTAVPTVTVEKVSRPTPASTVEEEIAGDQCQGEKWEAIPWATREHPTGDGWKEVVTLVVEHNGTPYWAHFSQPKGGMVVRTEGGYTYPIISTGLVSSDFPSKSIAGTVVESGFKIAEFLPPNFSAIGEKFGDPSTGRWVPVMFYFRVPESKHSYVLKVEGDITCVLPNGEVRTEHTVNINVDLSKGEAKDYTFPENVGQSTTAKTADGLKISFEKAWVQDYEWDSQYKEVVAKFLLENPNPNRDSSIYLGHYVIGTDLWIYNNILPFDPYTVGPLQKKEIEVTQEFPKSVTSAKLILYNKDENIFIMIDVPIGK